MKIKDRFNGLSPRRKKVVIWSLLGAILLTLTVTGYKSRSSHHVNQATEQGKETRLDEDLMEKTIVREYRRKLEELEGRVSTMQREMGRERKEEDQAAKTVKESAAPAKELPKIPDADAIERGKATFPPPMQPPQCGCR